MPGNGTGARALTAGKLKPCSALLEPRQDITLGDRLVWRECKYLAPGVKVHPGKKRQRRRGAEVGLQDPQANWSPLAVGKN